MACNLLCRGRHIQKSLQMAQKPQEKKLQNARQASSHERFSNMCGLSNHTIDNVVISLKHQGDSHGFMLTYHTGR